jgi:hypothetical protein
MSSKMSKPFAGTRYNVVSKKENVPSVTFMKVWHSSWVSKSSIIQERA